MNLPKKMVVVLVVVGLLFVAILFLPLDIGSGLVEDDDRKTGLLDSVSAPVSIGDVASACLSGTSLVWSDTCQVTVAPAQGILGRLRFRKLTLTEAAGSVVQIQYLLDEGDPLEPDGLDSPADVGVPPRGLTFRLFCTTLGPCVVTLLD